MPSGLHRNKKKDEELSDTFQGQTHSTFKT
jgi:hypothetical protein